MSMLQNWLSWYIATNPLLRSGFAALDRAHPRSLYVLMPVETLGIARSVGWKVHTRCAHGPRDGMKRVRECVYRKQLDIDTLVCTRGPSLPLSRTRVAGRRVIGKWAAFEIRACPHLSHASAHTSCNPAEKLRAVFS